MRHPGTSVLAGIAAVLLLVQAFDPAARRGAVGSLALALAAAALAVVAARATGAAAWALALAGVLLGGTSIVLDEVLGGRPRIIPGIVLIAAGAAAFAPPGFLRGTSSLLRGIAVVLHVAVILPFVAIGLVAPLWAVAVLFAVWAALLACLLRLGDRRPALALAVPPATLALMVGLFALGAWAFSWRP